jgi:DNA-binding Lrp family transcriptional regulator
MTVGYEELRRENEELKEEVLRLRRRVEELEGGEEPEEGKPMVIFRRGRRKGSGSHYDIRKLSSIHRKILYTLLEAGAVSEESGIPAVELRRRLRMGQGPLAGRVAELIHKGYILANRVRISFQAIGDTLMYRPETEIDPNLGVKRYKRFIYWITEVGKQALLKSVQPTDEFVKADLGTLAELRKAAEAKQEADR